MEKQIKKNFFLILEYLDRAEIISKNLPFSKKADIYFRVKRLIDKDSMGELFKVLLATNKNTKFKTGFVKLIKSKKLLKFKEIQHGFFNKKDGKSKWNI